MAKPSTYKSMPSLIAAPDRSNPELSIALTAPSLAPPTGFSRLSSYCKRHLWPSEPSFRPSSASVWHFLQSVFPILHWLPNYSVRDNLLSDAIAGFTILALHIPQGLAYGRLAGVEPIYGLYVSLFPVLCYSIMGTSNQISIGTFAVVSIACQDVLNNFRVSFAAPNSNGTSILETDFLQFGGEKLKPIEVLTSLALLVGIIQFLLGFFRLGILAILLSDPIISSFVVGSSFHVFTSQLFGLLGIDSTATSNETHIPFALIRSWYRLWSRLSQTNLATIVISASTISTLLLCKDKVEPSLVRKYKLQNIALPIDILCIVLLTILSALYDFNGTYNVQVFPKISSSFQNIPTVPRLDLMPSLFSSALILSFVIYVSTYSLEKNYAKKHGYEVRPNQELLALGTANIVSSFFLCYPASGSLSRSAVQDKVGARTQLASIISSLLVVIFILFLSTYQVETLPKCVLSSIIVVALLSTILKFTELFVYWKKSRLDGTLWLCNFTFVIIFGVDRGLLYGLTLSFVFLMIRLTMPAFNLQYHILDSELCKTGSRKHNATDGLPIDVHKITSTPGTVVFKFQGPLIFLNAESFKKRFHHHILRPIKAEQLKVPAHLLELHCVAATHSKGHIWNSNLGKSIYSVVFDCSRVTFLDRTGVKAILEMSAELSKLHSTPLFLAACSENLLATLVKCQFFTFIPTSHCFVSVDDAVTAAKRNLSSKNDLKLINCT